MAIPNLIHPIDIDIEQIDKGTTIYDPDTREPIQQVNRTTLLTIKGQPRWRSLSEVDMQRGGDRVSARGYIVFRKEDIDNASITIQINDKISRIGHQTGLDYYITRIEWIGHLPRFDGPSLMKAWFDDRRPSKQPGV